MCPAGKVSGIGDIGGTFCNLLCAPILEFQGEELNAANDPCTYIYIYIYIHIFIYIYTHTCIHQSVDTRALFNLVAAVEFLEVWKSTSAIDPVLLQKASWAYCHKPSGFKSQDSYALSLYVSLFNWRLLVAAVIGGGIRGKTEDEQDL